jgi:predicted nucleic acid-binding Zn ribbon protein
MPIYTYKCPLCGEVSYVHREIKLRDTHPPQCIHHPIPMARQLDAPMGIVDGPAVKKGE